MSEPTMVANLDLARPILALIQTGTEPICSVCDKTQNTKIQTESHGS